MRRHDPGLVTDARRLDRYDWINLAGPLAAHRPGWIGAGPEGVAAGLGSIWVVAQDAGRLLRIDPATRRVVDRIDIGVGARLVTTGEGAVWVSHFADNTVLRIEPKSGDVTASDVVCTGPQGLAVTAGRVWTACTFSDQVVGLDPESLAVTTDLPVAGYPDPLAVSVDGILLVVPEQGPAVVSIDATAIDGEVWVTSHSTDRVYHLPVR